MFKVRRLRRKVRKLEKQVEAAREKNQRLRRSRAR